MCRGCAHRYGLKGRETKERKEKLPNNCPGGRTSSGHLSLPARQKGIKIHQERSLREKEWPEGSLKNKKRKIRISVAKGFPGLQSRLGSSMPRNRGITPNVSQFLKCSEFREGEELGEGGAPGCPGTGSMDGGEGTHKPRGPLVRQCPVDGPNKRVGGHSETHGHSGTRVGSCSFRGDRCALRETQGLRS